MKKYTLAIGSLFFLGACAPMGVWTSSHGKPEYVWVGCHKVVENPSPTGEVAFGPFGIGTWTSADRIFFKQVSKDGTVGKVTTSKPCD